MSANGSSAAKSAIGRAISVRNLIVAALALALFAAALQPALAATYTYADDYPATSGRVINSRAKPSISGGSAEVLLHLDGVQTTIKTYYPSPGYREVQRATGPKGNPVKMTHERVSGATSGCSWYLETGGVTEITCTYTT